MFENQPTDEIATRTSARFNLISAGLAFGMWGGWAYYVNFAAGPDDHRASPLVSGLTQGIGSFLVTLVMVRAVSWLYYRLPRRPFRLVLPAVITVVVTGSCLAAAHAVVGTPDVVQTIAPALSVAFAFNIFAAAKLQRAARPVTRTEPRPLRSGRPYQDDE